MPGSNASDAPARWPVLTAPAALFAIAIATAIPMWALHAIPVAVVRVAPRHPDHFAAVYIHVIGGTVMLTLGAMALYVGWTRRAFGWHKYLGYGYLTGGVVGAGAGLALSIINAHPPHGIGVATGALAVTWLTFAAMALRAALNKRFDAHREWVIRSYVLTWTFVFCRVVMRLPIYETFGPDGITATIWLAWVVPLIVCEIALQWSRSAPLRASA